MDILIACCHCPRQTECISECVCVHVCVTTFLYCSVCLLVFIRFAMPCFGFDCAVFSLLNSTDLSPRTNTKFYESHAFQSALRFRQDRLSAMSARDQCEIQRARKRENKQLPKKIAENREPTFFHWASKVSPPNFWCTHHCKPKYELLLWFNFKQSVIK